MKRSILSNLLLLLAIIGMVVIVLEIFNLYSVYNPYLRGTIFSICLLLCVYTTEKKDYYMSLVFISIALIYNPFYPPNIDHDEWLLVHLPSLVFIGFQAYSITQERETTKVEMIAYTLDLYLKELEGIICQFSYYQTMLYLKKRYPQHLVINDEGFHWHENALPDFEFKINTDFYLPGQSKKGGVSAIGLSKFYSIEIHLNFALSRPVKYTISQRKLPNYRISSAANLLKNIMKDKYFYLDV